VRFPGINLDDMGRDEGTDLGPEPGHGAVLHQCSGEADFDGLPGDVLPPRDAVKRKLVDAAPLAGMSSATH
jgi:hypothetical protein